MQPICHVLCEQRRLGEIVIAIEFLIAPTTESLWGKLRAQSTTKSLHPLQATVMPAWPVAQEI